MLDTKFYEGSQKKMAFMYYESDERLVKYNVKVNGDIVTYEQFVNGSRLEEQQVKIIQGKIPNLAFRFNVIMIVLARTIAEINLEHVQLVLDSGFNEERQELIDQKKEEVINELAKAQVEKELQFKHKNKDLQKSL